MTDIELAFPERIQDKRSYGQIKQPHTHTTDIVARIKKLRDGYLHRVKMNAAMVADLLDLNVGNREFKFKDIKRYAEDMYADDYPWTGEPIIVSNTFRLIDGQKRLWAFLAANEKRIENGKPPLEIEFSIVVGPEDRFRIYLDQGVNRSAGDVLKDHGILKDRFVTAAAVRNIWYLEEYQRVGKTMPKGEKMDNPTLIKWVSNTKRLKLLTTIISKARAIHNDGPFVTYTMYAALWFIFHRLDAEFAETFFTKLATGEDLHMTKIIDSNITYLRQTLERIMRRELSDREVLRGDERVKYIIHVWNACRRNVRLEKKLDVDLKTYDIEKPI